MLPRPRHLESGRPSTSRPRVDGPSGSDFGTGRGSQVIERHFRRQLDHREVISGHVEDRQIGDHPLHDPDP